MHQKFVASGNLAMSSIVAQSSDAATEFRLETRPGGAVQLLFGPVQVALVNDRALPHAALSSGRPKRCGSRIVHGGRGCRTCPRRLAFAHLDEACCRNEQQRNRTQDQEERRRHSDRKPVCLCHTEFPLLLELSRPVRWAATGAGNPLIRQLATRVLASAIGMQDARRNRRAGATGPERTPAPRVGHPG